MGCIGNRRILQFVLVVSTLLAIERCPRPGVIAVCSPGRG